MDKERILLEAIDKHSRINGECLPANLADALQEVLSEPEQPPITQRRAYQYGYAQAELDLKREPLSVEAIDELTINSFYGGVFDFRIFARALEKAHGIVE